MNKQLLKRLREPSTWAGLSVFGLIFGLPAGTIEGVAQIVAGIASVAAIFLGEKADNAE